MVTLFMGLTLCWFVYALLRMARELARGRRRQAKTFTLVLKDRAEVAEGLVRELMRAKNALQPGMELVLVDAGSADDTPLILQRLARRYGAEFRRVAAGGMTPGENILPDSFFCRR